MKRSLKWEAGGGGGGARVGVASPCLHQPQTFPSSFIVSTYQGKSRGDIVHDFSLFQVAFDVDDWPYSARIKLLEQNL